MNDKIKRLVAYYRKTLGTNDPFAIADSLGILYRFCNIDFAGCYMFLKNHRCIFINNQLEPAESRMVMAHELGHALLHKKENCYFTQTKTLLLNSKIEKEANLFAAELLIPDEVILENWHYTTEQLSRILGYQEQLIELRLESYRSIL